MLRDVVLFVAPRVRRYVQESGMTSPLFYANALFQLQARLERDDSVRERFDFRVETLSRHPDPSTIRAPEDWVPVYRALTAHEPAVMAFSLYVWNVEHCHALARIVKQIDPEILLVAGGPEVACREDFCRLFPAFDVVIEGGGYKAFRALLERLGKGSRDFTGLPRTSCRRGGEWVHEMTGEGRVELPELPNVYAEHPELLYGGAAYLPTRGCPRRCPYCLWWSGGFVKKPVDRVIEELRTILESPKVQSIALLNHELFSALDDNDRILEALRSGTASTERRLIFYVSPRHMLDKRLIEMLTTSENALPLVGVQVLDHEILSSAQRPWSRGELSRLDKVEHGLRSAFTLQLLYPLPKETPGDFYRTVEELLSLGYSRLMISHLMVLRGTDYYRRRKELGLEHVERPPYLCFRTPDSSASATLVVGEVGRALTIFGAVLRSLSHTDTALDREAQRYLAEPGFLARLVTHVEQKRDTDDFLRTMVRDVTSTEYDGGFLNGNCFESAVQAPEPIGRRAEAPRRGAPATRPSTDRHP